MRTIKAITALVALLLVANVAKVEAQAGDWWFGFTYGAAVPSGDTKEFASGTSWRNFGIDGRKMIKDNVSVGFYAGWNVFDEISSSPQTVELEGTAITGTPFTYVNAFPLLATAYYYVGNPDWRGGIRGFIGAGAGAYVTEYRADVGFTSFKTTAWHLGLSGDAGVGYRFRSPFAMYLSARYNYGFKAKERTLNYWAFNLGVAWSN
jgi:hypothetical protein